jgi:MHS family proline/betaine transporter-like MFS transporter
VDIEERFRMKPLEPSPEEGQAQPLRVVASVTVANVLEWYDFAVYAFLMGVIAHVMFPVGDATVALLLSAATFGVGFLTRPVGALAFGALADRRGRKFALLVTFGLMGGATLLIGLIPSYAAIGLGAPLLVVLARLLQGLATGGVVGSATALLTEHAPPRQAGFYASWQAASQAGALLLGALIAAIVSAVLSRPQLEAWGWRVPFWASILVVPVGLYIRGRLDEPEVFVRQTRPLSSPLSVLLRTHNTALVRGFGITIIWTVSTYFFFVYVPLYAHTLLKLPMATTLLSNSSALAVMLVVSPVAGSLSDRFGRNRIMAPAALVIVLLVVPGTQILLSHPQATTLVLFQLVSAVLAALFIGPAPAAIAELFPVGVRSSGVGVAYNLSVTVFGGFAPTIATALVARTGNPLSPTWYVMVCCGLSLMALLVTTRGSRCATAKGELHES